MGDCLWIAGAVRIVTHAVHGDFLRSEHGRKGALGIRGGIIPAGIWDDAALIDRQRGGAQRRQQAG